MPAVTGVTGARIAPSKHRPDGLCRQTRWLHCGVVSNDDPVPDEGERMPVETSITENPFAAVEQNGAQADTSSLSRAIQEHLDLKQRNAELDGAMPIDRYSVADPFENHPLFKSEEQARLEETLEGVQAPSSSEALPWPGETDDAAEGPALDEGLWGRSRDFDWGE